MIYSIYNNPKVPDWSISAAYLSVDDPTELGVVYTTQPGRYMVYLSDKDLNMGDDAVVELPQRGKIHNPPRVNLHIPRLLARRAREGEAVQPTKQRLWL